MTQPDWEHINSIHPQFEYFEREFMIAGSGREFLVIRSIYQETTIPTNIDVHPEDTQLHLKIGQLLNTCTRAERDILGDILYLAVNSGKRNMAKTTLPIPQSGKELRRQFISNRYSLLHSVPHPPVFLLSLIHI